MTTKPNPYSRRKNVLTRKDKISFSKWATQPAKDVPIDRAKMWEALNDYVNQHGGRIVSPMHSYPLRVETPPGDSTLPDKLKGIGYSVVFKCTETRIGGPHRPEYAARWRYRAIPTGYGFFVVQIYEVNPPTTPDYIPGQSKITVV